MATNFKFNNGGTSTDFSDAFVPRSLFSQGGLWAWGKNSYGELGSNDTMTRSSSPVQTIAGGAGWKQVAAGRGHTSAIKSDGTLWSWGQYNGLGDASAVNKSSPVQTTSGGTNWKQVACGSTYYTAAIKTDGTLWVWGGNGYGQLGTNTNSSRSTPGQTTATGTNWKQVACGGSHTTAIKTDGTLWTWGFNSNGQLGDNTATNKSSPVQTIAGGTNWKQVSCGGRHTAAIKTDGTLWTWGYNIQGYLGDNTTTAKSSPVQTVASGANWKQVACGSNNVAAIKTDGTLWVWGYNLVGGCGDNTTDNRSSPVQTIAAGTSWKQVTAGVFHVTATKTDGTLWAWGANGYGQLGDNTATNKSSPVQTIAGGTNWKHVAAGYNHTTAITDIF